jgi:hypothetical protein
VKFELTPESNTTALSLSMCRFVCDTKGVGSLWPLPSGKVQVSSTFVEIDPSDITFKRGEFIEGDSAAWKMAEERFKEMQHRKVVESQTEGHKLLIEFQVESGDMSEKLLICFVGFC